MCGIIGAIDIPLSEDACAALTHRGPDGSGLLELAVGGHRVALGHRRLAILDLSPAGSQPMQTECRRHGITFNGEVYNHQELRAGIRGVAFRGHSDTETVLYALAARGVEALRDFNGIYAFGYLDSAIGKLYLARDPFGVKPLYYRYSGGTFAFSSEIRALLLLAPDTLDEESMAELLRLRYAPSPDTLYREVRKVRPGHVVEVDLNASELAVREYPVEIPLPRESNLPFDEARSQYGRSFEEAVGRQLMSDVEVGVLLSGGVDSALVARGARARVPYVMKAFTVGFEGDEEADEIAAASETAAQVGLEHHAIRIGFGEFLDTLRECVDIVEEPLATTSVVPMYHLAKLAASHVKVVLSGQGADEPLGGYARYQGEIWHRCVPSWAARSAGFFLRSMGSRNDALLRGSHALGAKDDAERFLLSYQVFSPSEIKRLIGVDDRKARARIEDVYRLLECPKRLTSVERMMAVDMRMNLADDLLLYTDKITMRHSLECRVPMLDLNLVSFIESLPQRYRVRLGRTKIIHKKYAERVLPSSIVHRKKKGFMSPTVKWFRAEGTLRDILLEKNTRFARSFNLKEVERVLREHLRGFNRERQLFLLLGIRYWMEGLA